MGGAFDFNRTPLAPPGTQVLVHEKPAQRGTWSTHTVDGWYLGPAIHHYRCYRVWIQETSVERIADTLAWFPTKVKMPLSSSSDLAIAAAHDLVNALRNPSPASPISHFATQRQPTCSTRPTCKYLCRSHRCPSISLHLHHITSARLPTVTSIPYAISEGAYCCTNSIPSATSEGAYFYCTNSTNSSSETHRHFRPKCSLRCLHHYLHPAHWKCRQTPSTASSLSEATIQAPLF
jgi:hypothetical protein